MSLRTVLVCALVATPSVAYADPPSPPPPPASSTEAAPTPPKLPACADADADGAIRMSTGCSGVVGVRGSVADVRGVRSGEGAGVMLSSEGQEYVRRGTFSARGMHRLGIGGGGAGFEGALLGGIAGGFRLPVGERHGPVVRGGVEGYVLGNDAFYASLLELPQAQLGYQYMRGITVVELGAKTGVVLTGRWRGGDTTSRVLGNGFEVGAYASVQVPWLRLAASATRLPTHDGLASPVDVAESTLCAISVPVAICADARVMRGDALVGGAPTEVRVAYFGLVLGVTRER